MSSASKVGPSRPLLRGLHLEDSNTKHEIHLSPNPPNEHLNKKDRRCIRYSNAKARRILLAISATLLATVWLFLNNLISFEQRVLEVTPSTVLEVFQVYAPMSTNPQQPIDHESSSILSTESCDVLLMEHSFGFSYGKPFIGMQPYLSPFLVIS